MTSSNMCESLAIYGMSSGHSSFQFVSSMPVLRIHRLHVQLSAMHAGRLLERSITIMWMRSDTLDYIKTKIQNKCGIPSDQLQLIHRGKQLVGNRTLKEYNLRDTSMVCVRVG